MNTDYKNIKYKSLTEKIIRIFYRVYNNLGYGFLEKVHPVKQLEIKAARNLAIENEAQLLNYLKATDKEVGLLLNFGPKPEIKRKVFDNYRK